MLSEAERKVLSAIESQLTQEDPKFAARLARGKLRHDKWLLFSAIFSWIVVWLTAIAGWPAIALIIIGPALCLTVLALLKEFAVTPQ